MRIEKTYEQNMSLGKNTYEFAKVGIKITSDKDISVEELPKFSAALGKLAKEAVQAELHSLKQDYIANK